jgi:DNA-binding transcriptional ArsR family regulator
VTAIVGQHKSKHAKDDHLELAVDWAPAYELIVAFVTYFSQDKHCIDELGSDWLTNVKANLPEDFKPAKSEFKHKQDDVLLLRLIYGGPHHETAEQWLEWLEWLTAGSAYELLAAVTPQHDDVQLPRDFQAWRDRMVSILGTWQAASFSRIDPAILQRLRNEAKALKKRLSDLPPRELVEQTSNGIWIEPGGRVERVVLVPQFHQRPYNDDCSIARGILLMYPADSVASPSDGPPLGLLRLTRGLGDESRLRILRFLAQGSASLSEVARFAGLSQPTVHHHLTQLRAAGLVRAHVTDDTSRRYSLRPHAFDQLSTQLMQYLEVPA